MASNTFPSLVITLVRHFPTNFNATTLGELFLIVLSPPPSFGIVPTEGSLVST